MRINNRESALTQVFVRQSWLGDALMCPERARLSALHPEMRKENDSAMMGTAVHAGIEAVLETQIPASDIAEFAVTAFRAKEYTMMKDEGKSINITNTDPKNWDKHIASMAEAWVKDIMPHVPEGGTPEFKFETKICEVQTEQFEYELWYEGTMDYFHPQGIWDWKTAARKYYEAEKQSQNIQSSVYALSAVSLGLTEFDVKFNFGVMIRNGSSTGQIVTVERTSGHGEWIKQQTISLVNTLFAMKANLPSERWLMNDQHFLCSKRWCPTWSLCKGSHIGSDNNNAEEAN